MNERERDPSTVLVEVGPMLAVLATRELYAEQPDLWKLGERGRARTLEDFNHHFRNLAPLRAETFRVHVTYCEDLFASRGFPHKWLEDAWRWMSHVIERELPPTVARPALTILREATGH